jgi:hypothetical protein
MIGNWLGLWVSKQDDKLGNANGEKFLARSSPLRKVPAEMPANSIVTEH